MSLKLNPKPTTIKGKREHNTVKPQHIETQSLSIKRPENGITVELASFGKSGAGVWVGNPADPLNGIAIYKDEQQMAIGLRAGASLLGAALAIDQATGEGYLQLAMPDGSIEIITASELVHAVRSMNKLSPPQLKLPVAKKAKKAKPAAAPVKKARKPRKSKKAVEPEVTVEE